MEKVFTRLCSSSPQDCNSILAVMALEESFQPTEKGGSLLAIYQRRAGEVGDGALIRTEDSSSIPGFKQRWQECHSGVSRSFMNQVDKLLVLQRLALDGYNSRDGFTKDVGGGLGSINSLERDSYQVIANRKHCSWRNEDSCFVYSLGPWWASRYWSRSCRTPDGSLGSNGFQGNTTLARYSCRYGTTVTKMVGLMGVVKQQVQGY
jgi:hypothetical protein